MNDADAFFLWTTINFIWSATLILCSGWLFSVSRKVENDRQKYRGFIRRQEEKQRNERKL